MLRYYIIYKPYQVLSQFTQGHDLTAGHEKKKTLKDYFTLPHDVYPVGRLDYDSEGLLILTNDISLNNRLLNPAYAHKREYWVQVEGIINETGLNTLRSGVKINVDGKHYLTATCKAEKFESEPEVPERNPPIRFRQYIPVCWIKIMLTEGKNRQVRKMTAQAGHPTLRLIRYAIENVTISKLQPGGIEELSKDELYRLLFR